MVAGRSAKTGPERRLFSINFAALVLALCWHIAVFFTLKTDPDDFQQFWRASVEVMRSGNLYATESYHYSSIIAYLISPLTLIDLWHAQRVWFVFNSCMLLVFLWLCISMSGSNLARRYWGLVILG
jgi:hypothetical protein